jgi:arginyl-tRNA synthetase
MPSPAEILQERLSDALQLLDFHPVASIQVAPTADPIHGDYQTNIAMLLAKEVRGNPRDLASRIAQKTNVADIGDPPEVAGPGFINFRLGVKFLAREVGTIGPGTSWSARSVRAAGP